ncbi:hypothetical protein HanXRQr2_Chr16g0747581 [Helianthus annuus]|uniref:Uncharacterized protein n=2 Tax=Helianthus annuus TaxID=4232 RepID=A0A9K3DSJ1_HELAN|nr:hypothetical protein HanXRQr2_Chr16g0747581 [Helianthus annuus]KAJ0438071.1 hypothetical protein HanHA300_Chr16g0609731 [Helianthus annuus]KAJ0460395.1 hypothetical protein HanHA89_Chr16g0660321 [Helianthus annuus]
MFSNGSLNKDLFQVILDGIMDLPLEIVLVVGGLSPKKSTCPIFLCLPQKEGMSQKTHHKQLTAPLQKFARRFVPMGERGGATSAGSTQMRLQQQQPLAA